MHKVTQLGSGERQGLNPESTHFSYYPFTCWVLIATRLSSSCGEWRLLFILVHRVLEVEHRISGSRATGSVAMSLGLHCSEADGIFPDWDRTTVSCIGRRILSTEPPGKPPGSTLLITILPASQYPVFMPSIQKISVALITLL